MGGAALWENLKKHLHGFGGVANRRELGLGVNKVFFAGISGENQILILYFPSYYMRLCINALKSEMGTYFVQLS